MGTRTPTSDRTDDHVVRRAAAGDPAAASVLDARYRRRLERYARSLLGRHHDAEDVVQDVFVKAHAELLAGRGPDELRPWLYRLTRNRAIDELRRARWGEGSLDERADGTSPLDDAGVPSSDRGADDPAVVLHRRESMRSLAQDLADLPVRQRDALLARVVDDASPQESAARLGVSVEAVQMLVVRARSNLERVRALRRARGDIDTQLMALASPGVVMGVIGLTKVAGVGGGKLVTAGVAAVTAVAAASGFAVVKTERAESGAAAPFALTGAREFIGHKVVRGQKIPDGTAVVAATVLIPAGARDRDRRIVPLQCPAGMRFATTLYQGANPETPLFYRPVDGFDAPRADGKVSMVFNRVVVSTPQRIRVRILCRTPGRGGSLLVDPRLPHPDEGRGTICHQDYAFHGPEHLVIGTVFRGQKVAITRHASRSVFMVTDTHIKGWVKTADLCPGWTLAKRYRAGTA